MVASAAKTIDEFLDSLPEDRRATIAAVRKMVKKHLNKGFVESMGYGMINYHIPLTTYPDTYNGQPLCYAGLAAQKNHNALYLMGAYGSPELTKRLRDGFAQAEKKLDMGKSCIRFKSLDDLPLDVVGESIAAMSPADLIATYEAARARTKAGSKKSTAKKQTTKGLEKR